MFVRSIITKGTVRSVSGSLRCLQRKGKSMECFYGWIQDIIVYMILVTLIYKLCVNSSYKPYIKLVTGFLMIVLMGKPLVSLGNGDFEKLLEQETINYQVKSARISQEIYEEQSRKIILDTYEIEMKRQLEEKLEEYGLFLQKAEIKFGEGKEYGVMKEISVTASYARNPDDIFGELEIEDSVTSIQEIKIAQWIEEGFGVEQENIHICLKR